MDCCGQCLCFKDTRRAFVGIGFFTMLLSLIQIILTVVQFIGAFLDSVTLTFMTQAQSTSKTVYELYIVLSCMDFFLLIFSLVLLCGNERTNQAKAKNYFMPWIIFIPFYVIYESGINIFYFYSTFHGAFALTEPLGYGWAGGFGIVPIVYWIIKDVLLIYGWMFLARHFQHYCRPVYFHSSSPGVSPVNSNAFYPPGLTVVNSDSYCKTCGAGVSQSPVASPSCGCNSGFKVGQQNAMIQPPAVVRYNKYV